MTTFDLPDLGEGLQVEATSDDGLVEAFTVIDSPGFTLAVQWHPEWKVGGNPVSMAIFRAFGDACRKYRLRDWAPQRSAVSAAIFVNAIRSGSSGRGSQGSPAQRWMLPCRRSRRFR